MILYSVHDCVSGVWQEPISAHNDSEACRAFMISCINPSIPESYLNDIALYRVGEFDEINCSGCFYPPVRVLSGYDPSIIRYRKVSNDIGGNSNEISNEASS